MFLKGLKIEIKIVDKTCCFIMEKYKLITPQLLPIIVLRWCAKELVVKLTRGLLRI